MDLQVIFVNNDNLLQVTDLETLGVQSGQVLNSDIASVTTTLVLSGTSTEVTGVTWPLGLTFVQSDGGIWEANLPDSLALTADQNYEAQITATAGEGFKGFWRVPLLASVRK
jgi:hypothetical protein